MGTKKQQKERTLEAAFTELSEVMEKMEHPEISLEDAFAMYHTGMDLLKECSQKIDAVEKQMLILDEEGETHEF